MAETDTKLAGKTGEDLKKAVLQKETELSDKTEIKPSEKLDLAERKVEEGETLDSTKYDIAETKVKESNFLNLFIAATVSPPPATEKILSSFVF